MCVQYNGHIVRTFILQIVCVNILPCSAEAILFQFELCMPYAYNISEQPFT